LLHFLNKMNLGEDSGNNWDQSKGQEDDGVLLERGHSYASSV